MARPCCPLNAIVALLLGACREKSPSPDTGESIAVGGQRDPYAIGTWEGTWTAPTACAPGELSATLEGMISSSWWAGITLTGIRIAWQE